MKECKIIRDLFPSYIDGLTSETTNQYIEEHLKNCEECKKVLEDMKKDLKLDETKTNGKEVQYIKKFSNKMKKLKVALIVILLIFVLSYARKMIIIVGLNSKASDFMNSTNYYTKTLSYAGESLNIIENYKKDEKYKRRYEIISEDNKVIAIDYYTNNRINSYNELHHKDDNVNKKVAILNKIDDSTLSNILNHIPNPIKFDNLINFMVMPLLSNITSEECNEKDCFKIVIGESVYYIEKETGLTIRVVGGRSISEDGEIHKIVSDYQYKFDCVTDEDFIEPDISEYEIQE